MAANKNDLYSMTTFMPRVAAQSSTADGTKRTPEDLEDELARMRECSKAALSSSWADAERLRTEATETETRIQEVARLTEELKEEKQLRKDELVEHRLAGDGEDISADARRASWFSWDDGNNTGTSSHLGSGAGGGVGTGDNDGHGDDDSIGTEDLAMIEKRFGGSTKPSAGSIAGVTITSSGEDMVKKSTDATTTVANSGERRISWQRNLVGTSSASRRSSAVDKSVASFAGSLGRLDEDSAACMDVSAGRLSLEGDTGSHPSLQGSGGKADGSLAAEERLMAQLSVIQAKMSEEASKFRKDIENRNDSIEKLQSSTREQLDEITILRREYNSIQSSMKGENEVLKCEIDALQSQVNRLLVQDAALDKEMKEVVSKLTAAQEQDQADEVNRLRAQVLAASENLKLARACTSAGPTAAAAAVASGVQHDGHGEEEEDGVHIDVDAVSDDMSAITAETFFSGGAPKFNK